MIEFTAHGKRLANFSLDSPYCRRIQIKASLLIIFLPPFCPAGAGHGDGLVEKVASSVSSANF
jgi:hypothetical protein